MDENRPDWFVISDEQASRLGSAPHIVRDEKRSRWLAHRSHLPLLRIGATNSNAYKEVLDPFVEGTTLRDYQEVGVRFLVERRGVLLADGCRLGKTAELVASHDPRRGSLVVIGPLAVRSVWLDWFRRRWPEKTPLVLVGRSYDGDSIEKADLIFGHYDILSAWVSVGLRRRIGTLVFDEAHALCNRRSKRTQAALIMAASAEYVVCATGTPLWNKAEGLWSLLSVVNPAAWGTFREFTERYASGGPGPYGWETGQPSHVEEFRERMSEVMIRRTWPEVQKQLPKTTRTIETVTLSRKEIFEIDMIAASIREDVVESVVVAELARIRRLVSQRKAPIAARLAQSIVDSGEPVVVWVWHRDTAQSIVKKIKGFRVAITGDTPQSERGDLLAHWRAKRGVLIVSMGVAPTGIDLSHAAHCIFAELDWTPAIIGQAAMRTFSPMRPNFETYIVAEHDIEFRLVDAIVTKLAVANVMGTPASDMSDLFSALGAPSEEADLGALANRISKRIREGEE